MRGTPQQIIDKYTQLARDAGLSGDRVAAENFQQHAEHYMRMLTDAQKEMDARREQHERDNRERQVQRDQQRADRQQADPSAPPPPEGMTIAHDNPMAVVDTPEAAEQKTTKPRPRRAPKPKSNPDLFTAPPKDQTAAE